jgi:nucleotide-binding universal stress UspA family protein
MSSIRQVLAHFNDSPNATQVLGLAARVAGVLEASLAAVYAVDPPAPGAFLSADAAALSAQLTLEDQQARWQQARTRAETTVPGLPLESARAMHSARCSGARAAPICSCWASTTPGTPKATWPG